jgi:hypothetical protein
MTPPTNKSAIKTRQQPDAIASVSKPQQQAASQVVLKAAVAHQKQKRRLALGETDVLERCPLIDSRRDQYDCAEQVAGDRHPGIQQGCPVDHPLEKGSCQRKAAPGEEITGRKPAGRGERLALRFPLSTHPGAYMRIMGAAEGAIIPTIITAHIRNTYANSIARHGSLAGSMIPIPAGIMRHPVMSMPSMSLARQST